jgi:hypothetical protein
MQAKIDTNRLSRLPGGGLNFLFFVKAGQHPYWDQSIGRRNRPRQRPVNEKHNGAYRHGPGFGFAGFEGAVVQVNRPLPGIRFSALDDDVVFATIFPYGTNGTEPG